MVAALSAFSPSECPRLVVKVGSSLLVAEDGTVRQDWLATLVADIAERQKAGQKIMLVSSGAIALGARRLGLKGGGRKSLDDAQAAAAAGQIALSQCWAELLGAQSLTAAQILVTLGDLEDRRRYLNAAATLDRLLRLDAIPLINENDSVATEEIRFGDNDRLAARIGQAARADGIILLSNVAGLYSADPKRDDTAELIRSVDAIDETVAAMAEGASDMGSGGMTSKIQAARIATAAGIPLAIVSGEPDSPLRAFTETGTGTIFAADRAPSARESWMAGRLTATGSVTIDAGAAKALRDGNSLLPAGVTHVTGAFDRGDVVDITDESGTIVARGLAEYDSAAAERIKGRQTGELEAILGYAPRPALVHRNHMVFL
ncbi:MAG: glutamate 5-kinase [Parasphingopyxis sp.]|uniref:glutamate 5-kinase n=1 Tax=Parasphingopyxis sp. TaxID=1920299 RepID=UPI003FA077A0